MSKPYIVQPTYTTHLNLTIFFHQFSHQLQQHKNSSVVHCFCYYGYNMDGEAADHIITITVDFSIPVFCHIHGIV